MHPKDKRIIISGCVLVAGMLLAILITGWAFITQPFPVNLAIAGVAILAYLGCYDLILRWVDQDL